MQAVRSFNITFGAFIYRQEATLNKSVGEGKIFYQPDEVDDFDEEDPDDDLDI